MSDEDLLARFQEYLVGTGMAPATIANYLVDIRNFSSWFRRLGLVSASLLDVNADRVRRYCQALRLQGRSVCTINRRLQAGYKFYDFVGQVGLSSHNPARDVERLKERSAASPRILTADEVCKLLCAVGDGSDSLTRRERAVLLLLLETGIKAGEPVDLWLDDLVLHVGSGYVLVGQDLSSMGRCLTIGPEVCAPLRACLRARASAPGVDHLFVSRQGRPLSMRSVQRLVSNYAQIAGLDGVSAHTLRCTFGHDVLQETQDLSEVAQMLDLRDVTSVRRYLG